MSSRDRAVDRANRRARAALTALGEELRRARADRGLSLELVGREVGVSPSQVSRLERGLVPRASYVDLARCASIVGLDLVSRLYPGPSPVRDEAHVRLLADLRLQLHPSLAWAVEVPLPGPGDQRAWDAMISGRDWRFGVEAETGPRDAQGLLRRLHLKQRDGSVDGVLLAIRDTWTTREFVDRAEAELRAALPYRTRAALAALRRGARPPGNAVIVVPRRRAR